MRKFMYLRVHLISTRDAKCIIYARKIQGNSCRFVHIFQIAVNFLPFVLVDLVPADSSAGFGAGAGAGALPGATGAADEAASLVTFPYICDVVVRYVPGYGTVPNVEAGKVFMEDRARILHWKIFRGISVRPLGAKTVVGLNGR